MNKTFPIVSVWIAVAFSAAYARGLATGFVVFCATAMIADME